MKCPQCKRDAPDDAAVCPSCEAVIDPSLYDVAPGPSKASVGGARPVVKKKKKVSSAAPGDWRSRVDPSAWNEHGTAKADDARASSAASASSSLSREDSAPFVVSKSVDPDEFFKETLSFMYALSAADKVAFFSAAGMVLACFFPWKETAAEGDVLGLMSQGAFVFLLGGATLAAIIVRTRGVPKMNPLFPWLGQLAAIGLSVLVIVAFMKLSLDTTPVRAQIGNEEIWASKPSFGAILALVAGVAGVIASAMSMKSVGAKGHQA